MTQKLQEKNPVVFDTYVIFDKARHKYIFDGRVAAMSASEFVKQYSSEFNSSKMAKKIIGDCKKIGLKIAKGRRVTDDEQTKYDKYGHFESEDQIIAHWDSKNASSAEFGADIHDLICKFYDGTAVPADDSKLQSRWFKNFLKFHKVVVGELKWTPYRAELAMVNAQFNIGGTPDMIYRKPNGKFAIVDWKTGEVEKDSQYAIVPCPEPFENFRKCKMTEYTVQVNIYAHMFKAGTGLDVDQLMIVSLCGSDYKIYNVPLMSEQTRIALSLHATAVGTKVPVAMQVGTELASSGLPMLEKTNTTLSQHGTAGRINEPGSIQIVVKSAAVDAAATVVPLVAGGTSLPFQTDQTTSRFIDPDPEPNRNSLASHIADTSNRFVAQESSTDSDQQAQNQQQKQETRQKRKMTASEKQTNERSPQVQTHNAQFDGGDHNKTAVRPVPDPMVQQSASSSSSSSSSSSLPSASLQLQMQAETLALEMTNLNRQMLSAPPVLPSAQSLLQQTSIPQPPDVSPVGTSDVEKEVLARLLWLLTQVAATKDEYERVCKKRKV
jgi:hypothetical protein